MTVPTVSPKESAATTWTACVYLSGLYIARWFNPAVPATVAELGRLIVACGDNPAAPAGNYTKLLIGMKALYGLIGQIVPPSSVPGLAATQKLGAVFSGDQINLTPHLQSNHVGHSIAVIYENGSTGVQLDPLAAQNSPGNPFPPAEQAAFSTPTTILPHPGAVIFIKKEPSMSSISVHFAQGTYTGRQFSSAGAILASKVGTIAAGGSSAPASQRSLIVAQKGYWYYITAGIWAGYWVQEGPGVTSVAPTPVPAPVPAPAPVPVPPAPVKMYTQAELDAAVAAVPRGFTQADLDAARASGIKAAADAAGAVK